MNPIKSAKHNYSFQVQVIWSLNLSNLVTFELNREDWFDDGQSGAEGILTTSKGFNYQNLSFIPRELFYCKGSIKL